MRAALESQSDAMASPALQSSAGRVSHMKPPCIPRLPLSPMSLQPGRRSPTLVSARQCTPQSSRAGRGPGPGPPLTPLVPHMALRGGSGTPDRNATPRAGTPTPRGAVGTPRSNPRQVPRGPRTLTAFHATCAVVGSWACQSVVGMEVCCSVYDMAASAAAHHSLEVQRSMLGRGGRPDPTAPIPPPSALHVPAHA